MEICERCGNEIPQEVMFCPRCGTHREIARAKAKLPPPMTNYGQYPRENFAGTFQPPFISPYGPPQEVNSALIAEVILSLFGIFGIGWLIGGETTIGVVLLLCSILLYWPLIIGGTIITFGLGLICLGPLAIGAIILNVLLLQRKLLRKTAQVIFVPTPPQSMPPRPQQQ